MPIHCGSPRRSGYVVVAFGLLAAATAAQAQFFRRRSDHGYSFTDCTSVVLMQEFALADVLSTDSCFAEAGLRPLLHVG